MSYTNTPTRMRIVRVHNQCWMLDGADNSGECTEFVWEYATHAEAVDAMQAFYEYTSEETGVVWCFDPDRPHRARHTSLIGYRCTRCHGLSSIADWFAKGRWPACLCGYAPRNNAALMRHWRNHGLVAVDRHGELEVRRA